jgi:hypothetical protein
MTSVSAPAHNAPLLMREISPPIGRSGFKAVGHQISRLLVVLDESVRLDVSNDVGVFLLNFWVKRWRSTHSFASKIPTHFRHTNQLKHQVNSKNAQVRTHCLFAHGENVSVSNSGGEVRARWVIWGQSTWLREFQNMTCYICDCVPLYVRRWRALSAQTGVSRFLIFYKWFLGLYFGKIREFLTKIFW